MTVVKRGRRASFRHLIGCKRLDCPVCGPGTAEREAADLGLAIAEHYARGGTVASVTLTMRHELRQALLELLHALGLAWRSSTNNRRPSGLWEAYTVGYVRKLEVTFGRNGWHPHLHLLVFLRPGVREAQLLELVEAMYDTWAARLVRLGHGEPTRERGIVAELLTLESAEERVAKYVAKDAGRELASAGTKRARRRESRSMYEVLVDAAAGDSRSMVLYAEYEDAMRGRARIIWSDGLKDELLDPELQDTAEDETGRDIAVLPDDLHDALIWNEKGFTDGPGRPQLLRWAELYDDDVEAFDLIWRQCSKHGLPPPSCPDRLRGEWELIREPQAAMAKPPAPRGEDPAGALLALF